eukprot:Nk52_evm45s2367 gene=Nk52_evmTU45s2367
MPVCVECGHWVDRVYRELGAGNIRLNHCKFCRSVVDKYVEYENVLIGFDLILHKPQVYRHIVYNKYDFSKGQGLKFFIKTAFLGLMAEVGFKYAILKGELNGGDFEDTVVGPLHPVTPAQLMNIVFMTIGEALLFYSGMLMAIYILGEELNIETKIEGKRVYHGWEVLRVNILARCWWLCIAFMLVWDYSGVDYKWVLGLAVLTSTVEAIAAVLNTSLWSGLIVCACGFSLKLAIQFLLSGFHFSRLFSVL